MNTMTLNLKEIKLGLTVGLMNLQSKKNILRTVRDLMLRFKEVGKFLGLAMINKVNVDRQHIKRIYSIRFEHCTLSLELISNRLTNNHVINRFYLN